MPRTVSLLGGLAIIGWCLLLAGCKDSGTTGVAGNFSGSNPVDLQVDTLAIPTLEADSLSTYSGNHSYFSVGQFNDPLFGDLDAQGLLKPGLPTNTHTFPDSSDMVLRLVFRKKGLYGDSTANEQFKIVEMDKIWRGNSWKYTDQIQTTGNSVASFTVSDQDSIDIPLSQAWTKKYVSSFNSSSSSRDSTYRYKSYGLAIIPQNTGKILSIDPAESHFILTDPSSDSLVAGVDSVNIALNNWAFSLQRGNAQKMPSGTSKIHSTLEHLVDFNFNFNQLDPQNISKADLVLYRNDALLQQSIQQAGATAIRPSADTLRLVVANSNELPEQVDPGNTYATGIYSSKDHAYHFNLTNLIIGRALQNLSSNQKLYITLGSNDGILRSSLLFNNQSGARKPDLIVTSIKKSENN